MRCPASYLPMLSCSIFSAETGSVHRPVSRNTAVVAQETQRGACRAASTAPCVAGRQRREFSGGIREGESAWPPGHKEDSMAEKNRKKTYLILIAILLVVLLITYL